MKPSFLDKAYAGVLLVVFGGIVLHAPLSVGFGSLWPDYALVIKAWKEILLLVAAVLAIIIVSRRRLWQSLSTDWVLRLVAAYSALHVVLLLWQYQGLLPALSGLAIDLRYVAVFGLMYILMKVMPQYRLRFLIVAALGAVVVVMFGVAQLFLPADILSHIGYSSTTIEPYLTVDQNRDFIRINSTLRGPNPLGAYIVIVMAIIASLLVRVRYRLKTSMRRWCFVAMTVGSLAVLWATYSRSALLGAVIAVGLVIGVAYGKKVPRLVLATAAIGVLLVGGGLFAAKDTSFVSNVLLHENPGESNAINSNEGHVESLRDGASRLVRQPLGAGIGSTGSASLLGEQPVIIENQYLFIAHESGWLGLLLFISLVGVIFTRLLRDRQDWLSLGVLASGVGLVFIGLLQPVWVDDTVAIVWWGLAAIALATGGKHGKPTK